MAQLKILVVDDERHFRQSLIKDVLEGHQVFEADSVEQAERILNENLIHLALVDIRLEDDQNRGDKSGLDLCKAMEPLVARIVLTGFPEDWKLVREALSPTAKKYRLADGFLSKKVEDYDPGTVLAEIRRVLKEKFEIIPERRIAVLTSGGDSPGMNAAIWSVVRTAMENDIEVIGVQDGYRGLVDDLMYKLTWNFVSDISVQGGTILGTARMPEFKDQAVRNQAADNILRKHITGLIVIGGDGSMNGAQALAKDLEGMEKTLQTIAIPGTIDNDLWGTDMTLGAASAANAMIEELRNMIRPAQALRRVFVVEVMGRYSGYLALQAAIGIGADAVLIPEQVMEVSYPQGQSGVQNWIDNLNINATVDGLRSRLTEVASLLEQAFACGKRYGFVILAEGIRLLTKEALKEDLVNKEYVQAFLQDEIKRWSHFNRPDVRAQDLGYMVRGGPPCRFDIWLGAKMGAAAVQRLLDPKKSNIMVGWSEERGVTETSFDEVVRESNNAPKDLWMVRPKWQELLELHRTLAQPPDPNLQGNQK